MEDKIYDYLVDFSNDIITFDEIYAELLKLMIPVPRFSVALVYQNNINGMMLRTLITEANSVEEALGKAIVYFEKETKDYGLILKTVTLINK